MSLFQWHFLCDEHCNSLHRTLHCSHSLHECLMWIILRNVKCFDEETLVMRGSWAWRGWVRLFCLSDIMLGSQDKLLILMLFAFTGTCTYLHIHNMLPSNSLLSVNKTLKDVFTPKVYSNVKYVSHLTLRQRNENKLWISTFILIIYREREANTLCDMYCR